MSLKCPIVNCDYEIEESVPLECKPSLLQLHLHEHQTNDRRTTTKGEQLKRPIVSKNNSTEDWNYFLSRWENYKTATNLTEKEKTEQLIECCDDTLRRDLNRVHRGTISTFDEPALLMAMKRLAVIEENILVTRYNLTSMTQDPDEPIRAFAARIQGQAYICNLNVTCPNCKFDQVDFSEEILKGVLTKGLYDEDIRISLLSHKDQIVTLEDIIAYVEAKESGKKSASRFLTNHTAAVSSRYKSSQRHKLKLEMKCSYCGKDSKLHGSSFNERKNKCPAFKHKCNICGVMGHFEVVCRRKRLINKVDKDPQTEEESSAVFETSVFDTICTFEHECNTALDHYVFDNHQKLWKLQPSDPQPTVQVKISICLDSYEDFKLQAPPAQARSVTAVADTGCQSCLAGMNLLFLIGLEPRHLLQTSMKMNSVNRQTIVIEGALFLKMSSSESRNNEPVTRQIVYFTKQCNKFYLSKDTCIKLGIIDKCFPIGVCSVNVKEKMESVPLHKTGLCFNVQL